MFDTIRKRLPTTRRWAGIMFGTAALAGCYAASRYNYLLFHSLVEVFAAIVACAVFMLFWNARRFLDNGFFLFFGIACLFAGIFDLLHALTYQGMSIFPGVGEDESLQLKTAGRMIASVSFLISPLFLRRKLNAAVTLAVYSGIFVAVLYGVFWGRFPDCYVPGWGMTHFEHFGRAINCVAFIAAAGLLVHKRRELDRRVFHLLLASLAALAASEFASAIAVDFNGSIKVAAHLLEVVSLYLIYAAFVEFGLKKPYDLVFRNLKASAERLRLHSQQSSLAAIEWDTDFRVVAWNPAAEKIFGYTAEEAAGQHWTFLVPSHARPKVDDAWARLSKGQVNAQSINENLTKDGRSILCDWHNTPLTNAEGGIHLRCFPCRRRHRAQARTRSGRWQRGGWKHCWRSVT